MSARAAITTTTNVAYWQFAVCGAETIHDIRVSAIGNTRRFAISPVLSDALRPIYSTLCGTPG